MALTDMKQSKKVSEGVLEPSRYPYGLDLDLDSDNLKKLGIKELPDVGTEMIVVGVGVVTSTHTSERVEGKADRNITIQLQKLEIGNLVENKTAEAAVSKAIKEL